MSQLKKSIYIPFLFGISFDTVSFRTHDIVHTEKLYGDLPFITIVIAKNELIPLPSLKYIGDAHKESLLKTKKREYV